MGALASLRFTEVRHRDQYPGLIGAWGFDEGTGLVAVDSSTKGSDLTVSPGMTWATGYASGTAIQNGGGGGAGGAFRQKDIVDSNMTIMGWARPLDLTSGTSRPLFGFWDATNAAGSTWLAIWAQRNDFGTGNVLQGNVRAGGSLVALNGSALTLNTWAHLALTYNGTNIILYKDGVSVATVAQPGAAYTGTAYFLVVPDSGNAQVDDVRVFNTTLSQAEIQSFMQQPVAVP
ncbi:MAG TPA: LamG domain-containing protein [Candidatus Saccharimonadales bacterium]|nr:LamG domain-containing protein [Candidatus Saccharimonadales bacterium]